MTNSVYSKKIRIFLNIAFFSLILGTLYNTYFNYYIIFVPIYLLALLPQMARPILALSNVLFFIFGVNLVSQDTLEIEVILKGGLFCLFIYYALFFLSQKFYWFRKINKLLVFIFYGIFVFFLLKDSNPSITFILIFTFFTVIFWHNLLILNALNRGEIISSIDFFANQTLFCNHFFSPIPDLITRHLKPQTDDEILFTQRDAFKKLFFIAAVALFIFIVRQLGNQNFLLYLSSENPLERSTQNVFRHGVQFSNFTTSENYFIAFSLFLGWLLKHFISLTIVVSLVKISGISIPNAMNFSGIYRNFYSFLGSFHYYYNLILVELFIYPIDKYLRKWKISTNLSQALASALGIFIFGFLYHFISKPRSLLRVGALEYFQTYYKTIPYFLGLALAVGFSIGLERKFQKKTFWARSVSILLYLFLYGLIWQFIFGYRFPENDIHAKFNFIKKLFFF